MRILTRGRLDGLLDLAGLEAARADVRARRLPAEQDADALEVRVEAAPGRHHRVAPAVPEGRLLPANCAYLRHGRGSVAEALSRPERASGRRGRPSRARR